MAGQREQIEEATRRAMQGRDRLTARQVRELEDILAEAARQVKEELRRFEEMAPLSSGQAVRLAQLEALKENISRIGQGWSKLSFPNTDRFVCKQRRSVLNLFTNRKVPPRKIKSRKEKTSC